MTAEFKFFIYLIEQYAYAKQVSTASVLHAWEDHGIVQTIYESYWRYHTERLENAFDDIDELMAKSEAISVVEPKK